MKNKKYHTASEQFQIPIEKYHTVATVPKSNSKNTTLSEQFQNPIEKYHTIE